MSAAIMGGTKDIDTAKALVLEHLGQTGADSRSATR